MARKGSRRRRYLRGEIQVELTVGSLAAHDAKLVVNGDTVIDSTWLSSVRLAWSLADYQALADAGPIMVGVCHSDYSAAEVEEWIENSGSWNEGDLVNQEIAHRKIRKVGILTPPSGATAQTTLNDGKSIHTKCGWLLNEGATLKFWAYNMGDVGISGALDGNVDITGYANLWPK